MLLDIEDETVYTWGDGSQDPWPVDPDNPGEGERSCCPGTGGSRLYAAKEAMRQMLQATGDIEFALMKYAQEHAVSIADGWTDDTDEVPLVDYIKYMGNQLGPDPQTGGLRDDTMRYRSYDFNGICYPSFAAFGDPLDNQWLSVPFSIDGSDNRSEILMWMDHHEFRRDGSGQVDTWGAGLEQELRAAGATPLAASMIAAKQYLEYVYTVDYGQDGTDQAREAQCRPYSVIILTDGEETCGGNWDDASRDLHFLDDTPGTDADGKKEVKIYVVGLNVDVDDPGNSLNIIAANGGTGAALSAASQVELSETLYQIINDSILVEVCDGVDNDCDGIVDEGFVLYCNTDGAGDACGLTGAADHATQDLCERPSECACDGIDNNCDGVTDEPPDGETSWPVYFDACGGCDNTVPGQEYCDDPDEGRCDRGNLVCTPGVGYECVGSIGPTEETCNNLDDDCDGLTDEGLTGDVCGGCGDGYWSCVNGQTLCCGVGSTATVCEPVITPTVEICDGIDNDCDGETDEDVTRPCGGCDGPGCGDPNEGVCAQGQEICTMGQWGSCIGDIGPSEEICDGLDNDCDGETDEDIVGASCGACDDGRLYCVDGGEQCCAGLDAGGNCLPVRTPSDEICDGLDNDCDGLTDEGLPPRDCDDTGFEDVMGVGICTVGYQICKNGEWGNNNPLNGQWQVDYCLGRQEPIDEICDGLDNNCNGEVDEDIVGQTGCGPCGDGHEECINGFLQCVDATAPTAEVCNGLDDNCNGLIDEGIFVGCGGCSIPDGEEIPEAYEDCLAAQAADENIGPGEGECQEGARFCDPDAADLFGPCLGGIGPSRELCDGKDNDCDGRTDEEDEIENVNEECATAVGLCEAGWWRCVDDGEGGKGLECCAEVTDDGLCIPPVGPEEEICDGLDNNCNGLIDEDLPGAGESCGEGVGVCEAGTVQCVCDVDGDPDSCSMRCVGMIEGTDEVCNGLDDDCDGLTDEDLPLGASCTNAPGGVPTGECDEGYEECINGEWVCNANEPTEEVCDGLDNDCDGLTDEDLAVECPDRSICIEGECAPVCSGEELQCPSGLACTPLTDNAGEDVRVCTTDVCRQGSDSALPCVENPYWCDQGHDPRCKCSQAQRKCVSICNDVLCPPGKVCVSQTGQCQSIGDDCYAAGCPDGEVCRGGECVTDPCPESCPEGEYCNYEGECVAPCINMDCEGRCFEGKCVDRCDGVSCDGGEVCNEVTGECEARDACVNVGCKYYQVCRGGDCVDDPCFTIKCPNGFMCEDGTCRQYGDEIPVGPKDTDDQPDSDSVERDTGDTGGGDSDEDTDGTFGMDRVLATGVGGCLCTATPGAPTKPGAWWPALIAILALLASVARRRFLPIKPFVIGAGVLGFALALGCTTEPYELENGKGLGEDTGARGDSDGPADSGRSSDDSDSEPDTEGCDPEHPDDDCDGVDNDCDGETDEGVDFLTNPRFCGSCDNDCRELYANAFGVCEGGVCKMGDCAPSFYDLNEDDKDGCEYFCVYRSEKDRCNGVDLGDGSYRGMDDDCDGQTDEEEDLNLQSDPFNCGRCGRICHVANATMRCEDGECVYDPAEDCKEGFYDINGDPKDGCEYACQKIADEEILCNGKDDDCDGETDEGNPEGGGACYQLGSGCTVEGDEVTCPENSRCRAGVWECRSGLLRCEGQVGPLPMESCNGVDDNCNGEVDENLVESCTTGGDDFREIGVCRRGYRLCVDGEFGDVCVGETLPSEEVCDGLDNDCDGLTDEGEDGGVLKGEPCGNCGGVEHCIAGQKHCCLALDDNGECIPPRPPSPEVCNGFDDDCDGITDNNITPQLCDGDDADFCEEGLLICVDGELHCTDETDDNEEVCDGLDNDCDGLTDAEDPDLVDPPDGFCQESCGDAFLGAQCMGAAGWQCQYDCDAVECNSFGQVVSSETLCDGVDNDCDGLTDEGLLSTVENCGVCGNDCWDVAGERVAMMVCLDGACRVSECEAGYHNLDGDFECEYGPCVATGDEGTVCDGVDNNCNGLTDEGLVLTEICDGVDNDCNGLIDDFEVMPDICNSRCPADAYEVRCDGADGWNCHYDCDVVDCVPGDDTAILAGTETKCDGLDNNCDGVVDEGFLLWGSESSVVGAKCNTVGLGACGRQGVVKCSDDGLSLVCCDQDNDGVYCTGATLEKEPEPGQEGAIPDGVDDDCDGYTDDGADGCAEYVTVSVPSGASFDIFKYEASRIDATSDDPGRINTVPCATDGVLPWTNISFAEARRACLMLNDQPGDCDLASPDSNPAGCWDLCGAAQWFYGCAYASGLKERYPYGDDYVGAACNGADYPGTGLVPSGDADACVSSWSENVWDMSGNAQEWTLGTTGSLRTIRGGGYKDVEASLTCDYNFWGGAETGFQMEQIGFRCCRNAAPMGECELAIEHIKGHPVDFDTRIAGVDVCSLDGFALKGDFKAKRATGAPATGNSSCLIATNPNGAYTGEVDSTAVSGVMNLDPCGDITITWEMYLDLGADDGLRVLVSGDGGESWYRVQSITTDSSGWDTYAVNVAASRVSDAFRLAFVLDSVGQSNSAIGAYIDDIEIAPYTGGGATAGTVDTLPASTGSEEAVCGTTLRATLRDFQESHPDFERGHQSEICFGIAQDMLPLVSDIGGVKQFGNPVLNTTLPGCSSNVIPDSAASFNEWYTDNTHEFAFDLTLVDLTPTDDSNVVTYTNDRFFLIGPDQGYGHEGNEDNNNQLQNFHFTTEINTHFLFDPPQVFAFTGDDDVWVYIDGRLVVDVGGVHEKRYGRVTFAEDGTVTSEYNVDGADANGIDDEHTVTTNWSTDWGMVPGYIYNLDVFHAERHTVESNFRIDTNLCLTNVQ